MPDVVEYSLLIDGDNINPSYLAPLEQHIKSLGGEIKAIHLFGKLRSSYLDDWRRALPNSSGTVKYNVSDNTKNSTDVRMLCVALQLYYNSGLRKFIIMSSDSDMESLVNGLNQDADIIVAYSSLKVSQDYLARLKSMNISCIDLDELRGPLNKEDLKQILNSVMCSYIQFKLSSQFFSFDTVIDWVVDRYPELKDLRGKKLWDQYHDIKITFSREGATISEMEE